jgi:hypothetical protein
LKVGFKTFTASFRHCPARRWAKPTTRASSRGFYRKPASEQTPAPLTRQEEGGRRVEIFLPDDWVELIGHEFEHVLEQVEGVDLAALVAEKDGQAHRHADGAVVVDNGQGVKR